MNERNIKSGQQNMLIINLQKYVKKLPKFHYIRTHSPSKLAIQSGNYFIICMNKILFGKSKRKKNNK